MRTCRYGCIYILWIESIEFIIICEQCLEKLNHFALSRDLITLSNRSPAKTSQGQRESLKKIGQALKHFLTLLRKTKNKTSAQSRIECYWPLKSKRSPSPSDRKIKMPKVWLLKFQRWFSKWKLNAVMKSTQREKSKTRCQVQLSICKLLMNHAPYPSLWW